MTDDENALEQRVAEAELFEFPPELSFLRSCLNAGEGYLVYSWWNVLKDEDKPAVTLFLQLMYSFLETQTHARKMAGENGAYTALFAIGSTARKEREYHDIDFLLITDQMYRDMADYDPEEELVWDFDYDIDPTIEEAYERHTMGGQRSLITLISRTSGTKIHLTLQPEVACIEDWLEEDKEAKAVVHKKGTNNPNARIINMLKY